MIYNHFNNFLYTNIIEKTHVANDMNEILYKIEFANTCQKTPSILHSNRNVITYQLNFYIRTDGLRFTRY